MGDDDDAPMVIVCAGPPVCQLQGDDAIAAAVAGCIWCKRITIHSETRETEEGPGHA